MALATKCPHCNTTFRVAHDQLKLRGGIVRCGSCNEVFDGNAALLEPIAKPQPAAIAPPAIPLPEPTPFDEKMAALDTRAAEVLGNEPIYTLELDTALEAADDGAPPPVDDVAQPPAARDLDIEPPPQDDLPAASEPVAELAAEPQPEPEPSAIDSFDEEPPAASAPAPFALPVEPAVAPSDAEAPLDLDLDLDLDAEPAAEAAPQPDAEQPFEDALSVEAMSDEELEAALEAELKVMEQTIAPEREPEAVDEPSPDFFAEMLAAGDRREPTLDDAPPADAATRAEPTWDEPHHDTDTIVAPAPRTLRDDELDEVDEEALVHLSSAGLAEAHLTRPHVPLHAAVEADEAAPESEDDADDEDDAEPGFVKRDRRRQKFGKAATIAMSVGSVLLVGALAAQCLTTFRNQIAAAVPPLKPALLAACATLGCKIELPAQIDDLTIEQGELQTLSDTTFSFTTLLRNQGATAQAWPHIELVLDDAADKRILRRVFTPRDYLGADAAPDKGFAPHTEQSVKLYFELKQLKASGYHIAVFYP
jgi:predicted Zn finger-like uncharacterized protein